MVDSCHYHVGTENSHDISLDSDDHDKELQFEIQLQSAIDIALRNNQIRAINIFVDYIVK